LAEIRRTRANRGSALANGRSAIGNVPPRIQVQLLDEAFITIIDRSVFDGVKFKSAICGGRCHRDVQR
jgi:hypothetical protein